MIRHIHVNDCDSTQDLLKEQLNNLEHSDDILVSCENQLAGRGRGDHSWKSLPGTLCLSVKISPHPKMSFTALELSVIVANFFEKKGRPLKLKWPNDLWNEKQQKCGGILIQSSHNNLLAGIGINLFSSDNEYGGVYETSFAIDKKEWARELGEFIINHRYLETDVLSGHWLQKCGHLNQVVTISEGDQTWEGVFQGLGNNGQAQVCADAKIHEIYNGSLKVNA
jgi:BirA family biotin operon repressor/biotin-[acetyl-CoA-carboxylase] ligase